MIDGHKYLLIIDSGLSVVYHNITDLEKKYYSICNIGYVENGMAKENFYDAMNNDGWLIINNQGVLHYFLEIEKIETIISELGDCEESALLKERFYDK